MLDYFNRLTPDSVRANNVKSVMAALEKYYAANGAYPVLPIPDSPLPELSGPLAGGGYISSVPVDPPPLSQQTHYLSYDGNNYGLWVYFEKSGPCIVEVRISGTGWWGPKPNQKLPPCQL